MAEARSLDAARRRIGDDSGAVTAELAIALPAVLVVLALCLAGLQIGAQQLRLTNVAADYARQVARGDSSIDLPSAVGLVMTVTGIEQSRNGEFRCVRVSASSVIGFAPLTLAAEGCALMGSP